MNVVIIILNIIVVVLWSLFLFADFVWQDVMITAVNGRQATYGEAFGPLSYFRPKILYLAFSLTCLNALLVFLKVKNEATT